MKKTALVLLVAIMLIGTIISGCVAVDPEVSEAPETEEATAKPAETEEKEMEETEEPAVDIYDTSESVELNMSVFYRSGIGMKYTVGDGSGTPQPEYNAPDGKTYREGDWKPVWAELQDRLNFTINDVHPTDAKDIRASFATWEAQGFEDVDVMVGNLDDVNRNATLNGTFLPLDDYLDLMPNFSAFLDANGIVKQSITTGDGHIYCAPYFDGYDDIERMMIMRVDWVQKLLDDDTVTYDTNRTVETHYTPFMPETLDTTILATNADGLGTQEVTVKYDKNIITIQNELAKKDGASLVQALKDYIDTTYAGLHTKRSDHFVGVDAAYNADELVALMRCVLANTELLTGQDEYDAVPFFMRKYQAGRIQQMFSFTNIFGVKGLESRSNWLYIDENGELQDGRFQPELVNAVEKMNMLYKEGLILQDFDKDESTAGLDGKDHRARLLNNNLGFMTFDYAQTTTVYNNTVDIEGFNLAPVIPPVVDWEGDGNYYSLVTSWRSVKPNGWAILSTLADDEAKLHRALALFDYQYSVEGNRLMSYGPEAWIDGVTEYRGVEVPKLADATLAELYDLANGSYTNYFRKWLGATFPIGYIKEQGMEFQTVAENGKVGLAKVLAAIDSGSTRHLVTDAATAPEGYRSLVPAAFPLTAAEEQLIVDNCSDIVTAFRNGNNDNDRIFYTDYIIYGFGGTNANGETLLNKDEVIDYLYEDLNGKIFFEAYKSAYARIQELMD